MTSPHLLIPILPSINSKVEAAVVFAASKVGTDMSTRRICSMQPQLVNSDSLQAAAAPILKRRRGEFAPTAIVKCISAACDGSSFAAGMAKE